MTWPPLDVSWLCHNKSNVKESAALATKETENARWQNAASWGNGFVYKRYNIKSLLVAISAERIAPEYMINVIKATLEFEPTLPFKCKCLKS